MKKIGIFYGTDGGNTHTVADKIAKEIGGEVDVIDISKASKDQVLGYENLILASSTYGAGDLQSDWEDILDSFSQEDFHGKVIGLVGLGDQDTYSDTFCDSLSHLYEKVKLGKVVGHTDVDGYDFSDTKSIEDGKFVGLVIDEDNQEDLSDERIKKWVAEIKPLFL
ncbi:flavodoxin [Helicobacter mustelae]|uniref:Flavodoxin n=1 Tax=Helicobacter mustelae (strain ATCC 43772 / CCUG 25715 / CIP 103759 / LMG 18044 / NCTC 12198 / R85-136P) TaxID=679897 RepID=D3UJJ8_HELM1|nr:flavodoxin [Helicobacter mustelae]CBG40674.1 flavodoxin 1 [Helicobacter mustelae 12198]SQH72171.1 flavodoxin 1 [Helicobacter mustelae]STP13316.1 flavodoxin 1 [Helicobacter mustelae]